jgi:hypothetical protein
MDNNNIQDQGLSVESTAQELAKVQREALKYNRSFPYGIINPDIFQNLLKPVVLPVKSIVLATLMTVSFSSAMTILGDTSQVSANALQSKQASFHQINDINTSPSSIVGNWKGKLYHQGDDTSTDVEMVINLGTINQGTWKFLGENNSVIGSGAVLGSVAGNSVTLEFKQNNKKPSWFYNCKLKNNNNLSCEMVGKTSWKLTLNQAK